MKNNLDDILKEFHAGNSGPIESKEKTKRTSKSQKSKKASAENFEANGRDIDYEGGPPIKKCAKFQNRKMHIPTDLTMR